MGVITLPCVLGIELAWTRHCGGDPFDAQQLKEDNKMIAVHCLGSHGCEHCAE